MHGVFVQSPLVPASFPLGRAWFVLAIEDHREAIKAVDDLGFETFCPVERRAKRIRGRRVERESPVFPGYMFTKFDREADDWGLIERADGVMGILKNLGLPMRMPDLEMAHLQNWDANGLFDKANALHEGQFVEITEGPFAGLLARVKSATKSKRVKILLDALGAIEIDTCFVKKV